MLIRMMNVTLTHNGWVYMQCEIRNTKFDLTTNDDQNDEL